MTCPPRPVATKDTGGGTGPVDFIKTLRGKQTTVASSTYTTGASVAVKVKISGSTLTAWVGTGDPKAAIRDSQPLRMQEQKRWHLRSREADGPGMGGAAGFSRPDSALGFSRGKADPSPFFSLAAGSRR